jgi:hypothetical protein
MPDQTDFFTRRQRNQADMEFNCIIFSEPCLLAQNFKGICGRAPQMPIWLCQTLVLLHSESPADRYCQISIAEIRTLYGVV